MVTLIGTEYNDKLNGKKNENNTLNGLSGNDIIKGSNLNDVITGGLGDDTITAGIGRNTIIYKKGDGNDIINLTKGENFTLKLENVTRLSDLGFEIVKKDLKIYLDKNNHSECITIKNFASKDITNNSNVKKGIADTSSVELFVNETLYNLREAIIDRKYLYKNTPNKNYSGSWLNEEIDASGYIVLDKKGNENFKNIKGLTIKGNNGDDIITGSKYNDTLQGGNGDDTITGGKGNDTITGGTGLNTINYSFGANNGNDIVNLTKGENFVLNIGGTSIDNLNFKFSSNNKDLIIYTSDNESITLKNFASKDVTNNATKTSDNTSSVIITDGTNEIDLRTGFYLTGDNKIVVNKNFTGTWLHEEIDASSYVARDKKGNEIVNNTKGLTVKGNNGDDIITGSKYNDTIQGGNGDDTISGGKGNDTITAGVGSNTIIYNDVFGTDTINLTKNENLTLDLSNYRISSINDVDSLIINLKGKDLILNIINKGTIILKNYTKNVLNSFNIKLNSEMFLNNLTIESYSLNYTDSDFIRNDKKKTASISTSVYDDNLVVELNGYTKTINSGNGNDTIIVKGDGTAKINSGAGSDLIQSGEGDDLIHCGGDKDVVYGAGGNDSIYGDSGYNAHYFKEGDGQDKLYMGKGIDILVFDKALKGTLTYERVGNNLIINYGSSDDSLTVINYFKTKSKSVETIAFADYNSQSVNILNSPETTQISLSNNIIQSGYYAYYEFSSDSTPGQYLIVKCQVLSGNSNNNLIYSSKKYDIVNAGSGNDTLYLQSKIASITNSSGNDKYIISSLKNGTMLLDSAGMDEIVINESSKNINFIFDVSRNDNYTAFDENRLYILNNSTLQKFVKTKNFLITSGIQIDNYFRNGNIEHIGTKDCYVTVDEINKIKNDVRNWLQKNNYNTALEALLYGSLNAQKELLAIYKNINWIQYTINGSKKDDIITGTDYGESIYGNAGNDTIFANGGDDYINAGKGNDIIYIGSGTDIIHSGEGNNTIVANTNNSHSIIVNSNGIDTIKFNTPQDIIYSKNNDNENLYLEYENNSIQLDKYFKEDKFSVKYVNNNGVVNSIQDEINNKLYIYGTGTDDTFIGSNGNDIFVTKSGNDLIQSSRGNDKILFENQERLVYIKDLSNNDLIISHNTGNITLSNYFAQNENHSVKSIINDSEHSIKTEIQNELTYIGTSKNENIVGTAKNNIIYSGKGNDILSSSGKTGLFNFEQGDGIDIITSSQGDDIIKFTSQYQLNYYKYNDEQDLIIEYTQNDRIILKNYFIIENFSVKKILNGENEIIIYDEVYNNLNILCKENSQTLYSTNGNQVYDLKLGDNIVYFNENSGNDVIKNADATNTLVINTPETTLNYIHNLSNNDLQISYGVNNIITIKDYFNNSEVSIDKIVFNDKNLSINEELKKGYNIVSSTVKGDIWGTDGNDTITVLSSKNNIYGDKGNDTYIDKNSNNTYYFQSGDGEDLIRPNSSRNTLVFDANISDLSITIPKQNHILITGYGGENDKLTYSTAIGYSGGASVPINIVTNDANINCLYFDLLMNGNEGEGKFYGSNLNDILFGSSKDEEIKAYSGDDHILANQGDDIINGGEGNNIMYFKSGDGSDHIRAGGGNDTLVFDTEFKNLKINNSTSVLIITGYGNEKDSVTIIKTDCSVKTIVTKDQTITYQQALSYMQGTDTNDTLTAVSEGGIIWAYKGNDNLFGSSNNDYLNGGAGNDIIEGNAGNDTLDGEDGNDSLYGGNGDDILIAGNGSNVLNGGLGDDIYFVTFEQNNYNEISYDDGGNDTLVIHSSIENLAPYFNVSSSGSNYATLYIKNKEDLSLSQGIIINSFDRGNYIIENIVVDNNTEDKSDDYIFTYNLDLINKITSEVASWLTANCYSDFKAVISSGAIDNINEILAIYNQVWEPREIL